MQNKGNFDLIQDEEGLELSFQLLKSDDGKLHYVALSEEKIYGQSTLNPVNEHSDLVCIESIFVEPGARGVGIGSKLLLFMEDSIKQAGFSGIFAKAIGESTFLYPMNSFLAKAGYICSGYQSHICKYSVDEIINSRFKEILDKLKGDKSVKSLEDISPKMIKSVWEKENLFINNTGKYSKTLSKVIVNDEHITAIVLCDEGDDTLCVKDIYILPANKDKAILIHILGALVKAALENNLSHILIRSINNHIEEGLSQCLVFPKSREYEQEFVKVL